MIICFAGSLKFIMHSKPDKTSFLMMPLLDTSVVISPSHDYTTFENNASTFTFNCSGNGVSLFWTVDGYSTGRSYVLNKGIQYTSFIISPDGVSLLSSFFQPPRLTTLQSSAWLKIYQISFSSVIQ